MEDSLMPQALEIEEAVLGAIMLEDSQVVHVADLKPEMFFNEANKRVCEVMIDLYSKGEKIDILTVVDGLRSKKELEIVGGAYYVSQLTNRVASAAHTEYHIKVLDEKHKGREAIRIGREMVDQAQSSSDILKTIQDLTSQLINLQISKTESKPQKIGDVVTDILKSETSVGIPSKFPELNDIFGGYESGKLYYIGARPGMGKTSFLLDEARYLAKQGKKVAFASLEMSKVQLGARVLSAETGVSADRIKKHQLDQGEFQRVSTCDILKANLFIHDKPSQTLMDLRGFAQLVQYQTGIDALMVDYVQIMRDTANSGSREREISTISSGLKALSKDLDIPVIALLQLSRKVEDRPLKKPQLSDLRESGSLEQDGDVVAFIYRPEYYKITEGADGEDLTGMAIIDVAKCRHGKVEEAVLRWDGPTTSFHSMGAAWQTIQPQELTEEPF